MIPEQTPESLNPFVKGAHKHFQEFCAEHGQPEDVLVTIRTRLGEEVFTVGFWIYHLPEVPGCVMIRGRPSDTNHAIVLREDDVASIQFQLPPESRPEQDVTPFGFYKK